MNKKTVVVLLTILVFISGIYFYMYSYNYSEGFETNPRCPNVLVKKDKSFYLYNSNLAEIPGVNPIRFNDLEDYTEFLEWQKSQKITCPVLFLQKNYDMHGNEVYKIQSDVNNRSMSTGTSNVEVVDNIAKQSLLGYEDTPAYSDNEVYQDIEKSKKYHNEFKSPDAMNTNWGGSDFTRNLIKKGYYDGNIITQ